jgi:hypothetical protein
MLSQDVSGTRGVGGPALTALQLLLVFQGLSGIIGGVGFLLDPTGASLGIPLRWLEGSSFQDYQVPGILLLTVLGLYPLLVTFLVQRRVAWARRGVMTVGVALIIWIGVEISVVGFRPIPPLQILYGGLGALLIVLSFAPGVREALDPSTPSHPQNQK